MTSLAQQPLSPLDGRYRISVAPLSEHLSEAALNRARVRIEVEWLIALSDRKFFNTKPLTADQKATLRTIVTEFGDVDIAELATLEAATRHDVKAVEYFLRNRLNQYGLGSIAELTHFACTSEDINNLAYATSIKDAINLVWLPKYRAAIAAIRNLAIKHRDDAMLSRTHGQPATPTTMGKELAVFVYRLERIAAQIADSDYLGKFSGATGTFAAHLVSHPEANWEHLGKEFVESLGLTWNPLTTQIEPHDWQAELYTKVTHANRVLHNLVTDIWSYISLGYFRQLPVIGATGSSTMPHKINPIRFENAEANLELSSAILDSLAATLVTSRLQRDLTDSSSQRNIGLGLGHSLLALDNILRGLAEIDLDRSVLLRDLADNWEILGEAVQTVIRADVVAGHSKIADPYVMLKELTRGRRVGANELAEFVKTLDISEDAKTRLLQLSPETYTGLASSLVDHIISEPTG